MYLIDEPYVSDFLVETISKNHYQIVATEVAKQLINDENLNWISEKDAIAICKSDPTTMVYTNSENALSWVNEHLHDTALSRQVKALKDKLKFRELTRALFPHFFYKKIAFTAIQDLSLDDLVLPFVIKPAIGFFSIGVHIVEDEEGWHKAQEALQPDKLSSIFPTSVLNTTYFIIEEFIEGEEFAIDYYHNDQGEVVLLNVLHHLFTSGTDTSDRVYTTSKEIITGYQQEIEFFLGKIGDQLGLKNFPAHAEIRINKKGQIMPIEINPLRSGGWCTTGDLLGVTLGFNAFECFSQNSKPDWDVIFRGNETKNYSIVILDNTTGAAPDEIASFNYTTLAADFEHPVLIRKLDIKEYPVFGFVFTETSPENLPELHRILRSDLRKYIELY